MNQVGTNMTLNELLERLEGYFEEEAYALHLSDVQPPKSWNVTGITSDSRLSRAGNVFGLFVNDVETALAYMTQAIENKVCLIIVSQSIYYEIKKTDLWGKCNWLIHARPRQVYAKIVSKYYGSLPQSSVAVTGTSGKTTVNYFVKQLWDHLKIPSASIGTLGVLGPQKNTFIQTTNSLTTPDPVEIHELLVKLKKSNVNHVVLEASSHGLDQHRLSGMRFKVGAFTNFSQDHLDYHGTMEAYFDAKKRLFEELITKGGIAVVNADFDYYDELVDVCVQRGHQLYSYGEHGTYMQLVSVKTKENGSEAFISWKGREFKLKINLLGRFQVCNVLCALSIVCALGADLNQLLPAVEKLKPAPGRLELAGKHPNGAHIYVDYAHKPGALEAVFESIREHSHKNIHVVFGCGGDRDSTKRALMGEIASQHAKKIYVTDDNPRTEDPAKIRQQVMEGCPNAMEIPDRKEAIQKAVRALGADDILIVAGKGHEKHQCIGDKRIPFDDIREVKEAIKTLKDTHHEKHDA